MTGLTRTSLTHTGPGITSAPPAPNEGHLLRRTLTTRFDRLRRQGQAGMTTAEYAVGTLAACAFAATLLAVVRSGAIRSALSGLIASALSIAS
jgi:hypothetical protein